MLTKEYIISTLKIHKPEFAKLGVKDIGLFGSFVRAEQSEKSDIDILIDFTNGMNCHDLPPKRTKKPAQDMGLAASDSV